MEKRPARLLSTTLGYSIERMITKEQGRYSSLQRATYREMNSVATQKQAWWRKRFSSPHPETSAISSILAGEKLWSGKPCSWQSKHQRASVPSPRAPPVMWS